MIGRTLLSLLIACILGFGFELSMCDAGCDYSYYENMCRSPNGRGGYDCYAGGLFESRRCASGYYAESR
jgi:hypothetical protein